MYGDGRRSIFRWRDRPIHEFALYTSKSRSRRTPRYRQHLYANLANDDRSRRLAAERFSHSRRASSLLRRHLFSRRARYGRPGFLEVLQAFRRFYDTEKGKVESFKAEILGNLQQTAALSGVTAELNREIFQIGLELNTGIVARQNPEPVFR